jgi:hypothetical protein
MEPKVFLNHQINEVIGVMETKGNKFGLELELEGRNVGLADVATKGWQRHHDGSLRGESVEFITAGAKEYDEIVKGVDDLFKKFKEHKVKFNDSIRTSTHVHLNFSDKTVKQVVNFFVLFTLLEEVLQCYSGEDRRGNLFCVSSREAEGIVGILANCIAKGSFDNFAGDRYKYAACNLSCLYKFGTVEIRTMRGANSAEQVNHWVGILNDMYLYALKMKSPVQLITDLSLLGAESLMRSIFSKESFRELMRTFPAPQTLHYSLMEGARILQVFAYQYDDAFTAVVEVKRKKVEGRLYAKMLVGRNAGHRRSVYSPRGHIVNCIPRGAKDWFYDGDRLRDDNRIYWSAERQRFCVDYPNDVYECRWALHEEMLNEAAQHVARDWPVEEEPEPEPEEWFEPDEDEQGEEW